MRYWRARYTHFIKLTNCAVENLSTCNVAATEGSGQQAAGSNLYTLIRTLNSERARSLCGFGPFLCVVCAESGKIVVCCVKWCRFTLLLKLNLASDGLKQIKFLPYLGFLP